MSKRRSSPSGIQSLFTDAVTFDAGAIGAAQCLDVVVAFPGALVSDIVVVSSQANFTANCGIVSARCNAADSLTIRMINPTAAPVDPASVTLNVACIRF